MKRAAIYARFSTEHQNEKSIEDQLRVCDQHCHRCGYQLVEAFKDEARSGTSMFGRDGLKKLMRQAEEKNFDVVIVESLDRLSRDPGDLHQTHKLLAFWGITIESVHQGAADSLDVAVQGVYNSIFIKNVRTQVRRGMMGLVERGLHPGGRAYGYCAVPGSPGNLKIIEAEATVIRRIFDSYINGKTPREIAKELNDERVPPPRGRYWTASTINGNRQRMYGILQNANYSGVVIWNRVHMVKDPGTGRRVSRINPKEEWISKQVPDLRIIEQDVFEAAQNLKAERGGLRPHQKRKPRHLFSGLLKCGCCGSGMSVKDVDHGRIRVVCTQAKEAGSCTNKRPYYLDGIEKTVLSGLKQELKNPEAIKRYIQAYNEEMRRLSASSSSSLRKKRNQLAKVDGEIQRAIDAIMRGVLEAEDVRERIATLKEEKKRLEREITSIEQSKVAVALHPTAITSYVETVENLEQSIRSNSLGGSEESKLALRDLIDAVIVSPPERDGSGPKIEVRGYLSRLIGGDLFPQRSYQGGKVVAEEGLEPPTRGL
jgi:site-specific DNA recombinase